jgi:hypothetical protein
MSREEIVAGVGDTPHSHPQFGVSVNSNCTTMGTIFFQWNQRRSTELGDLEPEIVTVPRCCFVSRVRTTTTTTLETLLYN